MGHRVQDVALRPDPRPALHALRAALALPRLSRVHIYHPRGADRTGWRCGVHLRQNYQEEEHTRDAHFVPEYPWLCVHA